MNLYVFSRVLHVLAVILWIGGVAMVTTVILPAIKHSGDTEKGLAFFHAIERRFKPIAQATTLITGATGFYMLYFVDGWWMFTKLQYWWVHAMVCVWAIFTVLLFVLEPLVIEKQLNEGAKKDPDTVVQKMLWLHWVLLVLSLITIVGTVAGAHGWFLIR